jgi:hypothetical protein
MSKNNLMKTSMVLLLSWSDKINGVVANSFNTINNIITNKTSYSANKIIDCKINFGWEFSQFKLPAGECKALEKKITQKIGEVKYNLKNNKCQVDGINLSIKINGCKNLQHFICENPLDNSCHFVFDVLCNNVSCKQVEITSPTKRELEEGRDLQADPAPVTIIGNSLVFNTCYLITSDDKRYADCNCLMNGPSGTIINNCVKKCNDLSLYDNWTPANNQFVMLLDAVTGITMTNEQGQPLDKIPFQQNDCIKQAQFINNICYLTANDNSIYKQCFVNGATCNSFITTTSTQPAWYKAFTSNPSLWMTPTFAPIEADAFDNCFDATMNDSTNNICIQSLSLQNVNGNTILINDQDNYLNCYATNINECKSNLVKDFGLLSRLPTLADCTLNIRNTIYFNNICYVSNDLKSWFKNCGIQNKTQCDQLLNQSIFIPGTSLQKVKNFNELDCFNWDVNVQAYKILIKSYNNKQYLSCNIPEENLSTPQDIENYIAQKTFMDTLILDKEKTGLCPWKLQVTFFDNNTKICKAVDFLDNTYTLCAYSKQDCDTLGSAGNLSIPYVQAINPLILQPNYNLIFNDKDCAKNTTIIEKNPEEKNTVDCCVSVNNGNEYLIQNSTRKQCKNLPIMGSLNNIDNSAHVIPGCNSTTSSSTILKIGGAALTVLMAFFI